MSKYIKKPIVIDAVQFFNDAPFPKGVCDCDKHPDNLGTPHIHDGGDVIDVCEGDWVITRGDGAVHRCKDSIFKASYDPVIFAATK